MTAAALSGADPAGNTASNSNDPLPALREDLVLYPRSRDRGGAPAWALYDPARNQFFYVSWPVFEILSRWSLASADKISAAIRKATTLEIDEEAVRYVAHFLEVNQLVRSGSGARTDSLLYLSRKRRVGWLNWLLHHYLFFRIPLLHPDRFLERTLGAVRWLGSRWFALATACGFVLALFLVTRQWTVFSRTLIDHMSVSGIVAFAITLVFAKILHEFGHAYTAKAQNCRVPTMGVAFLVTWPVLYTDVTDTWKLPDKRSRLAVGGAGVATELVLAIWSSFAWSWLPEGDARTACFLLATTTWISSLMINLSPFMRFDGYFLLMDLLNMPNLHHRAFAIARWQVREILFGLKEPCPEDVPPARRTGLVLFAFAVWAYRLVIFLGIAFLVYHFVIKIVGIALFAIEISWFVIMPILSEMRAWARLWPKIRKKRRFLIVLAVLGLLGLGLFIPWNTRIIAPAIEKTDRAYDVYVPFSATLEALEVTDGQSVGSGDVLARFSSMAADQRLREAEFRIEQVRYQVETGRFDADYLRRSKSLAEALKAAEAEKKLAQENIARLVLTAPFDGIVTDVTRTHQPGQPVSAKDRLMIVRTAGQQTLDAFILENDLPRIRIGDTAWFLPDGATRRYKAVVAKIAPIAIRTLSVPELASTNGGGIAVRQDHQTLTPERALYEVRLTGEDLPAYASRLRGTVTIEGTPESLINRIYTSIMVVLLRESGI